MAGIASSTIDTRRCHAYLRERSSLARSWQDTVAAGVAEALAIDSGGGALSGMASAASGLFRPSVAEIAAAAKATVDGKPIAFDGAFCSVDGIKFSKSYYECLWSERRPAPFLHAKEVFNSNPKVVPDPRGAPGYFKYEGGGLEMIYNPTTGQVGHIQPIKIK